MADVVVSLALEKLIDVIGHQLSLFAGANRELERLSSTFQSFRAILDDAERRQVGDLNVQLLLSSLRHIAYDVEDLVEDQRLPGLGEEEENGDDGNTRNKLCLCFPLPYNPWDHAVSRYKIARYIKGIRERLDQIDENKNMYGFSRNTQGGDDRRTVQSQSLTTSIKDESEMTIGREHDKELMIKRLVSESSHEDGGQAQVVAIFGIEGLGKTTLARQIYHDRGVQGYFNMFLWVRVSDVFDVIRLTEEIIKEVKGASSSLSELNSLQNELAESLRGKRFLLVLDDVRHGDAEKWNMLRLPLNSGAQGSRILVTTRSEIVANIMNATYIHPLKRLSDDQSWALFKSRAFAGWLGDDFSEIESIREGTVNRCIRLLVSVKVIRSSALHSWKRAGDYSEIESIGKEIVNTCRGVPFSIKVIGSYMNSKRTIEDWKNTLKGEIWSLPQVTDEILAPLLLTYYNLPPHSKQCFVYCSMFPKDWVFKKDMLVRLWVVQDFIRSQRNREVEDTGAEYFDDLVSWSMFQRVEDGKAIYYTMHNVLLDLAEFIARDEIYTFINGSEGGKSSKRPSSNVRHAFLSFTNIDDKPSNIPVADGRAKKLRTLWLHRIDRADRVIVDILRHAKFLRALSFMGSKSSKKMVKLPAAIWKMRHLRYLDFSSSDIVELPESVSHLRNLHTLDFTGCVKLKRLPESTSHLRNLHALNLSGCVKLKRLPTGMGRMVSLRHLEIEDTDSLECLPEGLGRITSLRSLCKFIVGGEGGCQIDELQQLNSLQGSLRIQHLERVSSREEAEKAELQDKPYLSRLVLSMSGRADADSVKMDGVMEGLRPHENLEELKLFWYTGSNLPRWLEVMPRLRKLELCGCPNLKGSLHSLDSASLRELMVRNCHRIEGISRSSSLVFLEKLSVIDSCEFFSSGLPHLPNLKTFEICRIRNETLPDGGWEEWTALETLEIWNCNELKSLPDGLMHLKSLQHLEVFSCRNLESLPNGLQQLPRLGRLLINGCPLLSERCRKGKEVLIGPRFHPSPISKSTSK